LEPCLELSSEVQTYLRGKKNLLAFSAGVDSSALFFLLIQADIEFDIALVNYGLRKQADEEESYAVTLAEAWRKQIFTIKAPSFEQNFEKAARDFRYTFFDEIMQKHHYDNLMTGHQLNDQLEWLLMRLTKGAGTSELLGLQIFSKRKNYMLVRPLLEHSKHELMTYLDDNHFNYFIDESNESEHYERNLFRKRFSNKLIENYEKGIKRSLKYLREDKTFLVGGYREVYYQDKFVLLELESDYFIVRVVDKYLKRLGYLLSTEQRERLKHEQSIVFGHLWAVEIQESLVYIAPYRTTAMTKDFKEKCRVLKIPSKVRPYLYEEKVNLRELLV
jgi:tRNA(Ile)-lysidine synthase